MNSVRVSLSFAAVIATPGKSFNKSLRNVFPSVTPCPGASGPSTSRA